VSGQGGGFGECIHVHYEQTIGEEDAASVYMYTMSKQSGEVHRGTL